MKRVWLSLVLLLCLLGAAAGLARWIAARPNSAGVPLRTAEGGEVPLPPGCVLLGADEAAEVREPFVKRADPASAKGVVLDLPEGQRSADQRGQARFSFQIPAAGLFNAWVRAWWRDACGNSIGLAVDALPRYTAGQDDVYGQWHWVRAGEYRLEAGPHRLAVEEREDGVAVDQVLLTPDRAFVPTGAVRPRAIGVEARRFADTFSRSPGHGLGEWDVASGKWEIAFSVDPNRMPLQYALQGEPAESNGPAIVTIKGPPWKGALAAFSVWPKTDARFRILFTDAGPGGAGTEVAFSVAAGGAHMEAGGRAADLTGRLRIAQWHRVQVERWAWFLRVLVDGEPAMERGDLNPWEGGIGLAVDDGAVVFDDVAVESALWQADDGAGLRAPWVVPQDARWYRPAGGTGALSGVQGCISASLGGVPVAEVFVAERDGARCNAGGGEWREVAAPGSWRRLLGRPGQASADVVRLCVGDRPARIDRVAVRYAAGVEDLYRVGPYDFSQDSIEDPSDYLDFTPEEVRSMAESPDAEKLRRERKQMPLVGARGDDCVWRRESGFWHIERGALRGAGPRGVLRYAQEFHGRIELRLRVSLANRTSCAEVVVGEFKGSGRRARIGAGEDPVEAGTLDLRLPPDAQWHEVRIRAGKDGIAGCIDAGAWTQIACPRGLGGGLLLCVPAGLATFDDFEVSVPREGDGERFCAFDRQEPGWWREGGEWIDHGGIACVLASNWITLVAPQGEGTIWNKGRFGHDLLAACEVQENGEWHGWDQPISHTHHPFDNIRVLLSVTRGSDDGYRLEVNSRNRSETVLFRRGEQVAAVPQVSPFPLRYVGGHAPYKPRRVRIALSKSGPVVRAVVNGIEVLRYEDPDPLPVERVGIGGYRTRANFTGIEIVEL